MNYTESWTIPKNIINLELAETSKFQYIIGWTIYKLTKSDKLTLAYKEFAKIKLCLNVFSSEQVEYICNTCLKTTTVIPGADFIRFMYYLESLIHQLFEKHIEYRPDILIYIDNNLANNQPLKKQFNATRNLGLALGQLKIWAQNNRAKSVFEKVFTLSDLKILIQAFQNKPVKVKEKRS
ncbi:12909_t:CDS:2 [Gigaspora margarita]|uniref:12909_t:CDS:1 n=1 Tax=Gigaspora margarita TaxID=4874 RepID=A0ABN7V0J5_GIGMA|nr:12909_t:CDS:2 [Gigaspora margarita]